MKAKEIQKRASTLLPDVKILIIEDDKDHLKNMKGIVHRIKGNKREFKLNIDTAESKEEAEKLLFEDKIHYHVLIVDIMLGGQKDGGMQIIEKLQELENERTKNGKNRDEEAVLVITGASLVVSPSLVVSHRFDWFIRQRARGAGVKAYFVKPFPLKEFRRKLLETIEEAL